MNLSSLLPLRQLATARPVKGNREGTTVLNGRVRVGDGSSCQGTAQLSRTHTYTVLSSLAYLEVGIQLGKAQRKALCLSERSDGINPTKKEKSLLNLQFFRVTRARPERLSNRRRDGVHARPNALLAAAARC